MWNVGKRLSGLGLRLSARANAPTAYRDLLSCDLEARLGGWTRRCSVRKKEMSEPKESGHVRLVGAVAGVGSGTYRGVIDCLVRIVRNESVFALYKGATPPAVGWAAIDSVLLGSLHNYRLFLIRHKFTEPVLGTGGERLTLTGHGIAGFANSAFLATPMEHLKIKLQMQIQRSAADRQYKGPIDCARQIIKSQGVFGLWNGFTGSLTFRSNFLWMFLSFEALMRGFSSLDGTPYQISTGTANFLSGGLGSFAFWFMAIPADNVKNRMFAVPHTSPKPSFTGTVRQIYTVAGWRGFFAGLSPCLIRAFPANACAFYVYEGLMRTLKAEKTRH
ncbi:hypothetical protein PHLGIDRAFT_27892 [Phlebiopsis gigantea 11061_1 CR5-6]|uniref:Mitochondrial carrier n=1 Tax=Phlebiopsis gigantea (strain 11061_1 CR5-6) TaxID=745531 RepID=A0A0C3SF37_PHLG1|nr:hypothetical protein PHLGIDRAFT_27892 [Phlebiopsis gigantea 11061_1 CR5-6]